MSATGCEKAMARYPIRLLLQRLKQSLPRFLKSSRKKIGDANPHGRVRRLRNWVKAQRVLEMKYREIDLPGPQSKPATPLPTACRARIERQAAVEQSDGDTDFFPKVTENETGLTENIRIVASDVKRSPREINAAAAGRLRVFTPAIEVQFEVDKGGLYQGASVARVTLDRPL